MTRRMREIAEEQGRTMQEILMSLYEQHGSQKRVAEALGISQSTLSLWLVRLSLREWSTLRERESA